MLELLPHHLHKTFNSDICYLHAFVIVLLISLLLSTKPSTKLSSIPCAKPNANRVQSLVPTKSKPISKLVPSQVPNWAKSLVQSS